MQDYTVEPDGTIRKVQVFQDVKDQLACAQEALTSAQNQKQTHMDYWDAVILEQQEVVNVLSLVVGDAVSKGAVQPQVSP
jgi:hypothetical protein